MTTDYAQAVRTLRLSAFSAVLDSGSTGGKLRIYGGTRPGAGVGVTTEPLLAELEFDKPSLSAVVTNTATLLLPDTVMASLSGTATWARFVNSSGVWVADTDVSDDPDDYPGVLVDTVDFYAGGQVSVTLATLVE